MEQENEPFITIDKLKEIFDQTLGSVRGSAGMILWSWVQYSNMSVNVMDQAVTTYLAIAWHICVLLVKLMMLANRILVDGTSEHKIDPNSDIIVITGGSSGLGLLLLAMFSSDGFVTVNVDIEKPSIVIANSHFYKCDVGSSSSVQDTVNDFMNNLDRPPSVLINCAGTVAGSMGAVEKLDTAAIKKTIDTNLLGTIYTTRQMLCGNRSLKMVVGISSSTALAGPAYAGIYAASKAGLRIFLESLRHELKRMNTRVLCVIPGQLDTAMFKDVSTPSQFWAPVIPAADVATQIHSSVLKGQQGEIAMPVYSRLLPYILVALPQSLVDMLRSFIGVDSAANSNGNLCT